MKFKSYLRECRFNVTAKCKGFFRTKNKGRHKAQKVCKRCRKRLLEFKISIERYMKMSEERKETIVWEDKEKCKLNIDEDRPIMDGKEVIGRKTVKETYKTTKSDLVEGIRPLKEMIDRQKKKLEEAEKKIATLVKKPAKTNEMVRFEKTMEAVLVIRQHNQIEAQKKQIEESIAIQETQYNKRQALIDTAPKA